MHLNFSIWKTFRFLFLVSCFSSQPSFASGGIVSIVESCRLRSGRFQTGSFEEALFPSSEMSRLLGRLSNLREGDDGLEYHQGAAVRAAIDYIAEIDQDAFPRFYTKAMLREAAIERAMNFISQESQRFSGEFWTTSINWTSSGDKIFYGHLGFFILISRDTGALSYGRKEDIANYIYSSLPIEFKKEEILKTIP